VSTLTDVPPTKQRELERPTGAEAEGIEACTAYTPAPQTRPATMGELEGASVPGQKGVGIGAAAREKNPGNQPDTGRQLLGALPLHVRKSHMSESIRARTSTCPVLDTIGSSRLDIPIGIRTLSSELLSAVEAGDAGAETAQILENLSVGDQYQHPELSVQINRGTAVEAKAISRSSATLMSKPQMAGQELGGRLRCRIILLRARPTPGGLATPGTTGMRSHTHGSSRDLAQILS
jgi:hypothetical protein